MHAQIVSNLAAMAQGQRLSAPPLEMIRSHLNHINAKVKELTLLYATPLPSPTSSSSSTAIPFAYPPGMTQLHGTLFYFIYLYLFYLFIFSSFIYYPKFLCNPI